MKIITINLPFPYLKAIQELVDKKIYVSRSSFIQEALGEFLQEEVTFFTDINSEVHDH